MNIDLITAQREDIEEINQLVNLSYRGYDGWTRETEIVSGERSTLDEVSAYISDPDAHLLVVKENNQIIACICVEQKKENAYIGYFAVNPKYQGRGLGKLVLSKAEAFAKNVLKVTKFIMVVVSQREELIAFYERRGYKKTGEISKYPVHLNVGIPAVAGLTIEYLEKNA